MTDEEERKERKSDRFRVQDCMALKMQAERSFETSINSYQCTRRHITEDLDLHLLRCENPKRRNELVIVDVVMFLYDARNDRTVEVQLLSVCVCLRARVHVTALHNINPLQPSGHYMYRQFNIQQFYVLPTQCIYVFCVDLKTNSDYFPIQQ